eukprot:9183862-Alexandrium_andersonii.AAC.1
MTACRWIWNHPDRSETWLLERTRLVLERRKHQANRQAQAQHLEDIDKPRGKGGGANAAKSEGDPKGTGKKGRGSKGDGRKKN